MLYNLKTTLSAYPKLTPSMLSDYVTKEELESASYINEETLTETLTQYTKDLDAADPSIIYGRQNVDGVNTWVPVLETPVINDLLCYGMINKTTIAEEDVTLLNKVSLEDDVAEYTVTYQPSANGNFWFCTTREIDSVINAGGLAHAVELTQQEGQVPLVIGGKEINLNCYRTEKLAAIEGIPYKFKVVFKEVTNG